MFSKRIRVAGILFLFLVILAVLSVCLWKLSEKYSKGEGELKVFMGNADMAEGVQVSVVTRERVWKTEEDWREREYMDPDASYFFRTRTGEVTGSHTVTGLGYEKKDVEELAHGMMVSNLQVCFPKQNVEGVHILSGDKLTYDLRWTLSDIYSYNDVTEYRIEDYVTFDKEDKVLYYYDENGEERYEAFSLSMDNEYSYVGHHLQEVDGVLYGYIEMEPKVGFWCKKITYGGGNVNSGFMEESMVEYEKALEEIKDPAFRTVADEVGNSELHMTVNKGIYRFDENGTVTCVFKMGERATDFISLWMVTEENTLTVIGRKGNQLLAYSYCLTDGSATERVLWDGEKEPEVLETWWNRTEKYGIAAMATKGERSYLAYTATFFSETRLVVFESGNCVFEGEVLQAEKEYSSLTDFSMNVNEAPWKDTEIERVEIQLSESK